MQLNEKVAEKHDQFVQAARNLFNAVNNGQVQADIEAAADGVELHAVEFKQVIAAFNDINTTSANGVSGAAFAARRNAMLVMEGISMVPLLVGMPWPLFSLPGRCPF